MSRPAEIRQGRWEPQFAEPENSPGIISTRNRKPFRRLYPATDRTEDLAPLASRLRDLLRLDRGEGGRRSDEVSKYSSALRPSRPRKLPSVTPVALGTTSPHRSQPTHPIPHRVSAFALVNLITTLCPVRTRPPKPMPNWKRVILAPPDWPEDLIIPQNDKLPKDSESIRESLPLT